MTKTSEHPLALPVGTELVGDYVITKVLGAGGFGITYEANERSLDRLVAIKEYFPVDIVEREGWALVKARSTTLEIKYARGLRRFIAEAKAITQFNHPNIVRVLRYFKTNNTAFMVLHHEEGVDMGVWRESMRRPPSQNQLEDIIYPLLDALETIHGSDFLHRDIAPDNIIIRKDGSPILIDFGSARSELTFNSKTVSALVKSGYSPFEQYAKNSKEQGPWTDIYSFGATLYQMVSGEAPPDSLSRLAVDEIIPAIKRSKKYYSRDFLAAIDTALAIKIADRPQSIDEWRSMLMPDKEALASGHGALQSHKTHRFTAPATRTQSRYKPLIQSNFLKNIGQSSVAELIKKAGLKTVDFGDNAARLAAKVKAPLLKLVPRNRPKLSNVKPAALGSVANLPLDNTPLAEASELNSPRSLRSLLDELDHRYKEGEHEQIIEKAAGAPLESHVAERIDPSQAQASSAFARLRKSGPTLWQKIKTARWPRLLSRRVIAGLVMLGAIGTGVGFYRSDLSHLASKVEVPEIIKSPGALFAPGNSALSKSFFAHRGGTSHLRLSANGQRLISAGADRIVKIWDAKNGTLLRRYNPHNQTITALDIKGERLIQADSSGRISLFDLVNSEQLASFQALDQPIRSVSFVGRGHDLITGGDLGEMDYWEFRGGEYVRRELYGERHDRAILAIVSHRRYFITGSADATTKIWRRSRRKLIRTYRGHTGPVSALALSPKAYRLATGSLDDTIRIWSPRARRVRRTMKAAQGGILSLAFAKNGKWLASGGSDGSFKIWNARNGKLVQSFRGQGGAVRALLFSADAKRLITANKDGKIRFWNWNKRRR